MRRVPRRPSRRASWPGRPGCGRETPETPEAPTPGGKLPQTGDELPIAGICALAAAGCAASVIGIARSIGLRRREEEMGEED